MLSQLPEVNTNSLDLCEIELGPKIGEGQFAEVFIGRLGGEHVACKKQRLDEEGDLTKWNRLELKVLQFCDHPHVLKYLGCCATNDGPEEGRATWIVTEYVACGDLLRLLEDSKTYLEWYWRIRIARELADAVSYLHGRNLMHRDIKSSNVLLDGSWRVKLGDFGMATEVCNGRASTLCGTNEYMAPELHFGETESYGQPADVYSMGMVLVELATRQKASVVAARSPRTKFTLDEADLRSKMEAAEAPGSFIELAMQCLAYEDYDRLASEDAEAWLEELVVETPLLKDPDAPQPLPLPDWQANNNNASTQQTSIVSRENDEEVASTNQDDISIDATPTSTSVMSAGDASSSRQQQQQPPPPRRTPSKDVQQSSRPNSRNVIVLPSNAAARRIHSLREVGIETTRMAGYLHKKAKTSFASRYQRRWFVLKRGTLLWFNAPGNANALGRVSLSSTAELVSTATTKFAIFARPAASAAGSEEYSRQYSGGGRSRSSSKSGGRESAAGGKRKPLVELMAPDETTKDMWLQALQTEIDERVVDEIKISTPSVPPPQQQHYQVNEVLAVPRYSANNHSDLVSIPRPASSEPPDAWKAAIPEDESKTDGDGIARWIDMLRLPRETADSFVRAGYSDLGLILESGIEDDDLDFIGITVPLHRRILKNSVAEKSFTHVLCSKVVDYRICGSVALYAIASKYKYRRSTLHLRYANFVTLFAKLRSIERERQYDADDPLPKLPGSRVFVDQKGPQFLEQRRRELDEYLQKTISIARNNPNLEAAILAFLDLADPEPSSQHHQPLDDHLSPQHHLQQQNNNNNGATRPVPSSKKTAVPLD